MIDFSLNLVNNKKVLINYILYILNDKYIKDAVYSNDYNYNLFISCLDRFFNCSHISNEYKDLVRKKGKNSHYLVYLPKIELSYFTFSLWYIYIKIFPFLNIFLYIR